VKKPTTEAFDYGELLDEIEQSNPRAAILMAAAFVDHMLERAVAYNFVSLSKADHEHLFAYPGPLSSFAAKIRIGFAMGLYTKKLRHDLNSIRGMRNDLAHSYNKISKDDATLKAKVVGLHALASEADKNDKEMQLLLTVALRSIAMFLLMRSIPNRVHGNIRNIGVLRDLDFSTVTEVKRRDVETAEESAVLTSPLTPDEISGRKRRRSSSY
jgi:DNA-binding MltR family transcriptional regulator